MKRMRQWIATGTAVGLGLLLTTGSLLSQERVQVTDACPSGLEEGSFGISGLDCVGECSLMIWGDGSERSWSFSTEPRILSVEGGSPAHGVLQEGDFLVAIDGLLITTKEGGNRYANLQPGEQVRVRYRRDGRVREARLEVRARCRETRRVPSVGRRVPVPATPDEPEPTRGIVVAPRVRVTPDRRARDVTAMEVEGVSAIAGRAATGILVGPSPTGKLGIGFQCSDCGTQTDEETGEDVWFFSGSLEVTAVNAGGAADKAGIRRGDLIKAIDGHDMASEEGGLAFTHLEPGQSVRLTVVKRNGSEVEVDVVPETVASAGVGRGREPRAAVVPRETVGVSARALPSAPRADARPERPPVPDRVEVPEPTPYLEPPEGMPLRYSGTVNGVEVEVRGDPVSVSEARGLRTIYINAEGLWIRITVPGRTALEGGRVEGLSSSIRR